MRSNLSRLKVTAAVRPVAKRFVLGVPAAAQRHVGFSGGQWKFIAQMIHDFDGPKDNEGTVLSTTDGERLSHRGFLCVGQAFQPDGQTALD